MNKLLAKEIRLLLPAFGTALLLAIAPLWLLPNGAAGIFGSSDIFPVISVYPLWFAMGLLAVSCFGREFSLQTFPVLLAQPLERATIWRTKITVLTGAMTLLFGASVLSWVARILFAQAYGPAGTPGNFNPFDTVMFVVAGTMLLAAYSGGLWTTLLLRQVSAPFWFTILLPATLTMVVSLCGGNEAVVVGTLILYSLAGYWLARRMFLRAEETAWTGGIIALPGWKAASATASAAIRRRRPWFAMIRKEFQLHQLLLVAMAGLFAVHLGTLAFRHVGDTPTGRAARLVSDLCCMLWFVVPLLAGATNVAEERKLGMMEGHLCLPISTRFQFSIKLLVVVLLGGVLSASLFWVRATLGHAFRGLADYGDVSIPPGAEGLTILLLLLSGVALLAFYGSTLSRNLMQALVTGVITVTAVWAGVGLVYQPYNTWVEGIWPWKGSLVYFIGAPTMVGVFVWLSCRNYQRLPETGRLWRRNLLTLACALLFIGTATAALYNRAWEYLSALEPVHGPARLTVSQPPVLRADSSHGFMMTLVLPDGRLWENRVAHEPNRRFHFFDKGFSLGVGGKWMCLAEAPFVAGSNWVDAIAWYRDTAAIRSDGTLWVSAQPRARFSPGPDDRFATDESDDLVRFGSGTNWKSLVTLMGSADFLLLKTDGTLWEWQPLNFDWKNPWPGLRSFEPYRLGTNSDWLDLVSASGEHYYAGQTWLYVWDKSGRAWTFTPPFNQPKRELAPGKGIERGQFLDQAKWRSITGWAPQWAGFQVGVREDGTLWLWDGIWQGNTNLAREYRGQIARMGRETNWVSVAAGSDQTLVALKTDGTLWRWRSDTVSRGANHQLVWPADMPPMRMGTHHDWVAVCGALDGIVSLAADGSLWLWNRDRDYWEDNSEPLISTSRRPVKFANIFGQE